MTRTRYRFQNDFRVVLGVRLPGWLALDLTEDDGTTPSDVSGDEFALTLKLSTNPTVAFSPTVDMTQAATGHVEWELDTTVAEAEVGVWDYDVVWVKGGTPATDPIFIDVGGQVEMQQGATEVPA
jgi:hypothetical protein